MSKCPSCQKSTLIRDKNFCEEQLVCTECGAVVSDITFENDQKLEGTTYVGDNKFRKGTSNFNAKVPNSIWRTFSKPSNPLATQESLSRIEYLASELHMSKPLTEELKTMHLKVVSHEMFKFAKQRTKITVGAVCAYILLRRNNWPISIKRLCKLLDCDLHTFSQVYKQVQKISGANAPHIPLKDSLERELGNINLKEEKDKILPLTKNISRVILSCNEALVSAPQSIALVVTYLAWKSIHWGERGLLFKDFASKFEIKTKPSHKSMKEIETLLIDLISNIPWLKDEKIDKNNIVKYISDLVTYPNPASLKPEPARNEEAPDQHRDEIVASTCSMVLAAQEPAEDEDFSDSEISSYIRSDAEIMALKALRKRLLKID